MELTTLKLTDFTKLATVIWLRETESVTNYARESGIFRVMDIPNNAGETREFSEIDGEEYLTSKAQGDQAKRGKVQQGYTNTMSVKRFGKNIGITYEMRKFNKYPEVVNRLTNLARQGPQRIDLDLSHRLTFGTATSYTDMDGASVSTICGDTLALFSTAHTLKGSSTTYRNRLANNPIVSQGALELMERQIIENTYNQFGQKKTMNFSIIWTTDDPVDMNTVKTFLRSTSNPNASNDGTINVNQAKYRHVMLPRVPTAADGSMDTTKRKYWGLACPEYSSLYLGVWEEPHMIAPTEGSNAEDALTDDWDWRIRGSWGIVAVGSNWIHFSSGDGVA